MKLSGKHFFFCYNKKLSDHIQSQGIDAITVARSADNDKTFTMFQKTKQLQIAIDDYKLNKPEQLESVNEKNERKFFYCYDRELMNKLKKVGILPVTTSRHLGTQKVFNLYLRNNDLNNALDNILGERSL